MKKASLERSLVVVLFVMVLVVFSLAERDTRKLGRIYKGSAQSIKIQKAQELANLSQSAYK